MGDDRITPAEMGAFINSPMSSTAQELLNMFPLPLPLADIDDFSPAGGSMAHPEAATNPTSALPQVRHENRQASLSNPSICCDRLPPATNRFTSVSTSAGFPFQVAYGSAYPVAASSSIAPQYSSNIHRSDNLQTSPSFQIPMPTGATLATARGASIAPSPGILLHDNGNRSEGCFRAPIHFVETQAEEARIGVSGTSNAGVYLTVTSPPYSNAYQSITREDGNSSTMKRSAPLAPSLHHCTAGPPEFAGNASLDASLRRTIASPQAARYLREITRSNTTAPVKQGNDQIQAASALKQRVRFHTGGPSSVGFSTYHTLQQDIPSTAGGHLQSRPEIKSTGRNIGIFPPTSLLDQTTLTPDGRHIPAPGAVHVMKELIEFCYEITKDVLNKRSHERRYDKSSQRDNQAHIETLMALLLSLRENWLAGNIPTSILRERINLFLTRDLKLPKNFNTQCKLEDFRRRKQEHALETQASGRPGLQPGTPVTYIHNTVPDKTFGWRPTSEAICVMKEFEDFCIRFMYNVLTEKDENMFRGNDRDEDSTKAMKDLNDAFLVFRAHWQRGSIVASRVINEMNARISSACPSLRSRNIWLLFEQYRNPQLARQENLPRSAASANPVELSKRVITAKKNTPEIRTHIGNEVRENQNISLSCAAKANETGTQRRLPLKTKVAKNWKNSNHNAARVSPSSKLAEVNNNKKKRSREEHPPTRVEGTALKKTKVQNPKAQMPAASKVENAISQSPHFPAPLDEGTVKRIVQRIQQRMGICGEPTSEVLQILSIAAGMRLKSIIRSVQQRVDSRRALGPNWVPPGAVSRAVREKIEKEQHDEHCRLIRAAAERLRKKKEAKEAECSRGNVEEVARSAKRMSKKEKKKALLEEERVRAQKDSMLKIIEDSARRMKKVTQPRLLPPLAHSDNCKEIVGKKAEGGEGLSTSGKKDEVEPVHMEGQFSLYDFLDVFQSDFRTRKSLTYYKWNTRGASDK